jgi:DNA polymerase III subunit beta
MANTTIILDKADLTRAMAHLSRIVERKGTIPILANVRIAPGEDIVTITATDLDMEARTHIECRVSDETPVAASATTVPAATLSEIARKLPEDAEITISWAAGETRATVSAGRSRFSLQALPAEDFPDFQRADFTHGFDIPAETLTRILAKVSLAMSTEETRYYLNGIHLHVKQAPDGPMLVWVATDGHRLSKFEMAAPEGADTTLPPIIIPAKTVAELARLAKDHKGQIRLHICTSKFGADIGNTSLNSKLIDGTFPDYDRVIPRGNPNIASLNRAKLERAVDLVSTMASDKGRAVKFGFREGALNLIVNNPDSGTAEEEIEASLKGQEMDIGFNGRYVADALTALGSEHVEFHIDGPGSPAILRNPADDSVLMVLMPMRV